MIKEKLQPLFALILLVPSLFWLYRIRAFIVASLLLLGLAAIASGVVLDFVHDGRLPQDLFPGMVFNIIESMNEEKIDLTGVSLVCLAMVVFSLGPLNDVLIRSFSGLIAVWIAAILITIGNSLAHSDYHPSMLLASVALVFSLTGCLCIYTVNRLMMVPAGAGLFQRNESRVYIMAMVLFILLPSFWSRYNYFVSLVIWLFFTYVCWAIYRHAQRERNNVIEKSSPDHESCFSRC